MCHQHQFIEAYRRLCVLPVPWLISTACAPRCLPDRRIAVPAELDIVEACKHLVEQTKMHPHIKLAMDDDAKEAFDSYGLMFNCRSNQHRRGQNADLAAEEGTEDLQCAAVCM